MRIKTASTHRTVRTSAAGGLDAPSALKGATFSTWLTRIAAIISACGFQPDLAETAFQTSAANVIAVRRYSVSNPDLPRRFTIGQVTENKNKAVVPAAFDAVQ
jgi:hypothetical protein